MKNDDANFYSDPQRYDLIEGADAAVEFLDFCRRRIAHYGQPALEPLACPT
ncbi:MAG TPA: hypothetical protein VGC89_22125 [Pyrinomonadaceae bacterium]|jgi:hypothetical protein